MSALTQIACFVLVACTALACTTTFHTRDGREFSGEVARSSAQTLEVELSDGGTVELRRDEIESVEHAGTDAAIAGGVMLGLALTGFVAAGVVATHDVPCGPDDDYCGERQTGQALSALIFIGGPSLLLVLVGAPILAGGIGTRGDSIERYEYDPDRGDVQLTVAPWGDLDDEGRPRGGVGVEVRY